MWSVRLTDSQRDALRLLLDAQGELGPSLTGARESLDLVGLDVAAAIGDEIGAEVPARIGELIAAGSLGRKTGRGFYEY